jgi:hypothetical protein
MADTLGSLIDKLATINQKMFLVQEDLYAIRKMDFEEFKKVYGSTDEGLMKLYSAFKKACDLNVQRQQMILEVDKKVVEMIESSKTEDLNNGSFIQDQHKTY